MAIPSFVDLAKLRVIAGRGGNGCASIHREKFKPLGGPDGGNGGNGGSVILRVDDQVSSLIEYHRMSERKAGNGEHGRGDHQEGARGADIVLRVPEGTVVRDLDTGELLADLTGHGTELVVAEGGRGGLGNEALASKSRRAPGFALLGEPGEERLISLELKVVADIGLVGFPSAGKSSLIAAISRAKPKIADYPFTTLVPNLGVVVADDVTYTVADVPGLIEGASQGRGLGHEFLRHIERCRAIVHVIDCATYEPGRDPLTDLSTIERELTNHGGLDHCPRLVALNKIDVPDGADLAEIARPDIEALGYRVFPISTKTSQGLTELIFAMADLVKHSVIEAEKSPTVQILRPKPVNEGDEFTIRRKGDGMGGFVWAVSGHKPDRWVDQTDFRNDEAVGYLSDRLNRLGVEAKLLELGAKPGDAVSIGRGSPVVFDFQPQIDSGAERLGRRGHDIRLETERPSATRRRELDAAYHAVQGDGLSRAERGLQELMGQSDLDDSETIWEGTANPSRAETVWDVDQWDSEWGESNDDD